MTSPVRKRRDRSRRRIVADALEIVSQARELFCSQPCGDTGANLAPLTRSDTVLINRAIRSGWDVPEAKRVEIVRQIGLALDGDDDRLVLAVAQTTLLMEAANLLHERTG